MALMKIILRPWRLAPFSQTVSLFSAGLLIFLSTFLLWVDFGLAPIVASMEGRQVITAFLSPKVAETDEKQVVDSIRMLVGSAPEGRHAKIEARDAAELLGELRRHYPHLADELDSLGNEKRALVPRLVSVSGHFQPDWVERLKNTPGVDSVESSLEKTQAAVGAFRSLRWISRVLVLFLTVCLVTVLFHLCRLNFSMQLDAVQVMAMLGANRFWIRFPNLALGFFIGLAGSVFAIALWSALGDRFIGQMQWFSPALAGVSAPGAGFKLSLLCFGALVGAVLGVLGSLFAERKSVHDGA